MMIGMDFGTTNTRAALYDGAEIQLMPLDPANRASHIARTAIYITQSKAYYLGSNALNLYFHQNVGRPTRYRKVWVGEIIQVFAELPTFYRDVYVYEDEFSPGRLFLSIKTGLRNPSYYGTVFQDSWYAPSDLAAIFLLGMKRQMEKHLQRELKEIVLGRPVVFSDNPDEDKIAQSRLLRAAFKAGFEKVYLEYEPVAAALAYERTIRKKELVLVFDFGGGTLDFTIMEIGDPRHRRVLATGGIPVAGDVFDQRLFRATIPRHLGEGDFFISAGGRYPIPAHIFDLLTTPQEVISLNTPQNLEMLRSIHQGAVHKEKTHALLKIVSSNYALLMFDLIEKAKRDLSSQTDTQITLHGDDFLVQDTITRLRFERAIQKEFEAVREGLEAVLKEAGVTPKDIDRVIRTGGSSQIPLFGKLLHRMFGYGKVEEIDIFSSVTSGLAIRGYEISQGLESLSEYTPANVSATEEKAPNQVSTSSVNQIELDAVLKHLEATQELLTGEKVLPQNVILVAGESGVATLPYPTLQRGEEAAQVALPNQGREDGPGFETAAHASIETCALLVTNTFKLISVPLNSLFVAQELGEQSVRDLLRLDTDETVTAGVPWRPDSPPERYLGLVTRYGQARVFDAHLLAEQVTKKPYFQLEKRYIGSPAGLVFMEESSALVAGTTAGRITGASRKEMGVAVYTLFKPRKNETVSAVGAFALDELLVAISAAGLGLPCKQPGPSGTTLRKGFEIAAFTPFVRPGNPDVDVLTTQGRLVRLPGAAIAKAASPTNPAKLLRLLPSEKVLAVLTRCE